ncbi:hypothetical protein [Ruegeria sp. SCP11]|uniref:hypothetical protein n=1 Tax=Ruegeria sp. SCP11 TaxID=3141378 RepID=UPI003336C339
MVFSTKSARRGPLSAELRDWCEGEESQEARTVVLTLSSHTDVDALNVQLETLGGAVLSAGPGATVATLPRPALIAASTFPGVVRIEAPVRLAPKNGANIE